MRTYRSISLFLLTMLSTLMAVAQNIIVNVTPVQEVLPPQLMLYIADPGKYFNISLTNTSSQAQEVYLVLELQQVSPSSGLTVLTPPNRQPATPIVVPAEGVRQLTMTEIKTLFNHIPSNEIMGTPGLVGDYLNGTFGLLPEGLYKGTITAYQWAKPKLANPVIVSNPASGSAFFTVCYKAQAPQILTPFTFNTNLENSDVAELDALNPMFTWTQPIVPCSPGAINYKYSLKIVEVLKNQHPAEALLRNPVVYRRDYLLAPQCIIPQNVLSSKFYTDRTYVAQVTATSNSTGALDYVMIENEGKSMFRQFKIKVNDPFGDKDDDKDDDKDQDDDNGDKDKDNDSNFWLSFEEGEVTDSINNDSLYSFRNPMITQPLFIKDSARKQSFHTNLDLAWINVLYMGGEGDNPGDLKFEYIVELFNGGKNPGTKEEVMSTKPIYSYNAKDSLSHSVNWDNISDKFEVGDYILAKITPHCTNATSVAYINDTINIIDFALYESVARRYFECSNMIDIDNKQDAKIAAKDLRGKTVTIGEYELKLDGELSGDTSGLKGKGHVEWNPMGTTVMVCVEFDGLKINSDMQVYEGVAKAYSNNEIQSDIKTVNNLFSDKGIDDYIGDTAIPYADQIQNTPDGQVKDLAKKIDLKRYYEYVKKGGAAVDELLSGNIENLYMPVALPKSINKTPVDIQISGMTFSPEYATMSLVGEFVLPNSDYLKNDILVLGAPRLCISPDNLLPEGGTIALLSDFTISDPRSSYEMTFKAPADVVRPDNGCYIAWKDYSLDLLGIDMDMKIPGLVKDINGKPSNEKAVLNLRASISDWDDWMVDNVTIDPFQVKDLPGWTFTASDVVYDHSVYRNSTKMGKFPVGYDKKKAGITSVVTNAEGKKFDVDGDNSWEGLFIKEISLKFPDALEFGDKGDKRLNIAAKDMFFDQSGATLEVSANDILSGKTGKAGGWSFSLDKVYASFLQNDFSKCGFSGKFSVPVLSGEVGYNCDIYPLNNSTLSGDYAYVFKTQQVEGLSLDFMLAKATFDQKQTYFLLESLPTASGKQDTKVELMMGGDITLGNTSGGKKTDNSPMSFSLPGVHFTGMRLANCKTEEWTSTYEKDMQTAARNVKLDGISLYEGKDIDLADGLIYLNLGQWSFASPEKKIGAFTFSLSKYDFYFRNKKLTAELEGTIKLVSGVNISASTGIAINANVNLPKDLSKIYDISLSYGSTDFKSASISVEMGGMELSGSLEVEKGDKTKEGYTGSLKFKMPGDLFTVEANGGYYKYEKGDTKFSYGFFKCALASNMGIEITPVKITSITAGFYYNCGKDGDGVKPQQGVIGVIAGIKLATTAGEDALSASMDMTVVYDGKNDRLSTFIFTGDVKAVGGLLNAKANLVYENNDDNRYLQLDITIDAKADTGEIGAMLNEVNDALTEAKAELEEKVSLSSLKSMLNSEYEAPQKLSPTGNLTEMSDNQSEPDKPKHKDIADKGENLSASAGAEIGLQFKITWREEGTTYDKAKWHLYIGEPSIDKRCKITFLKFKSDILSVDIGANAYLCLGNELPDNGKLPPIPQKVAQFLNGSGNGKGIESASLTEANRARESSLKDFDSQITKIGGGLMFGAQVYGYLDVDLGIFYLNAGATAGFDISIIQLPPEAKCLNFSGKPGINGWYGYGQLYAYLYAKFGIRINLGFWKKDFDICDAGIGGLFQMQGPRPSHFEGKARVKLKLLGGLVNIDRRFSFACGQSCDLFMGNALDNFKLFGDLSIGYDNIEQGWDTKNAIDPDFIQRPYFTTEAPLNEPFRVLDETEKARLAKNYTGDKSNLDMEASRTFIFRSNVGAYIKLEELDKETGDYTVHNIPLKGQDRYINYLDLISLNPNRFYCMTVTGYAKEMMYGKEVDPLTYDEEKNKFFNTPWSQSKTYYFCTGPKKAQPDCPSDYDFEKLIAIAYPSYYNKVKEFGNQTIYSYVNDVKYPNIAFYSDIHNKMFRKGKLVWKLYDEHSTLVSQSEAKWSVLSDPKCCNLTVENPLDAAAGKVYTLCLEYLVAKTSVFLSTKSSPARVTYENTRLVEMKVYTVGGNWQKGYNSKSLAYEKPFIGSSICNIKYENTPSRTLDAVMIGNVSAPVNGKMIPYRMLDPYMYISYLSNYAFIGGWEFSASRLDANITTCQSLIYTDKGGVYEGVLGTGNSYNVYNEYNKVRKLSTFTYDQYNKFTSYPLPQLDDEKYNYTLNGFVRVPQYTPGENNPIRVSGYIADLWSPVRICQSICETIHSTLYTDFEQNINLRYKGESWTKDLDALEDWYQKHRGNYFATHLNSASIQIPAYQFPIIYGSCLQNTGDRKQVTAWGTLAGYSDVEKNNNQARGKRNNSLTVYGLLLGNKYLTRTDGDFSSLNVFLNREWDHFEYKNYKRFIKSADFDIYRVNTYDIENCNYSINASLRGDEPYKRFTINNPLEYYNNYGK